MIAAGVSALGHRLLPAAPDGAGPAGQPDPSRGERPDRRTLAATEARFQEGYRLLQAERYGEAHRAFEAAARMDPTDPRPHVGIGKICEALDYDQRAEAAYAEALRRDPGLLEVQRFRCRILSDLGRNEEASAVLRSVLEHRPDDVLSIGELAVSRIRLGLATEAVPLLERFVRLRPDDWWGHVHLGRARVETGKPEDAETSLRRALELHPQASLGHLWLGQLLVSLGRRDEATRHFDEFRRLRELETRETEYEQAVARRPDDVRVHVDLLVRLAHVRHLLGKEKEALVPLGNALGLPIEDPTRRRKLFELYQQQRRRAGLPPARRGSRPPAGEAPGAAPDRGGR